MFDAIEGYQQQYHMLMMLSLLVIPKHAKIKGMLANAKAARDLGNLS
jgi:hypothetical protein